MSKEIEIKLRIENIENTIAGICSIGAREVRSFVFEDNILFDTQDGLLKKTHRMLRIRECDGNFTLALKEGVQPDSPYKIRTEYETSISNVEGLEKMFDWLGLTIVYRYQKYRAEYRLGALSIFIDKTPIGNFIELEGDPRTIDEAAARLGFNKKDYINVSYLTYHTNHLKEKGLPPCDMVFTEKNRMNDEPSEQ